MRLSQQLVDTTYKLMTKVSGKEISRLSMIKTCPLQYKMTKRVQIIYTQDHFPELYQLGIWMFNKSF